MIYRLLSARPSYDATNFFECEDYTCIRFCNGGVGLVVYLDLVIFLNISVDFLLLLSANRLAGYASGKMRCLIGSVIGGIYGGLCLCPGLQFLQKWYWCIAVLVLVSVVSFGWRISAVRRGALFALLSMTLGGIAGGLDCTSIITLILGGIAILLLCIMGFSGTVRGRKCVNVELYWKGNRYPLKALVDTGNTLVDPASGSQVLVVNPQVASEVFNLTQKELLDPIETIQESNIHGLRLIPYRTVGCSNGILIGISVDYVVVNGQKMGKVIAFSPDGFGDDSYYQALAGGIG